MACLRFGASLVLLGLFMPFAHSQDMPGGYTTYRANQKVSLDDLPAVKAQSKDAGAVMLAAVEIILHDQELCCGKDSALVDVVASADPSSVKALGVKLQGRQHLSDGRPIIVTAEYVPASAVNPSQVIGSLLAKHALLMQWNARIYVLYGAIFDEAIDSTSGTVYAIHKLLLLDPRFSGERREVSFNRDSDDFGKVQGMLLLTVAQP